MCSLILWYKICEKGIKFICVLNFLDWWCDHEESLLCTAICEKISWEDTAKCRYNAIQFITLSHPPREFHGHTHQFGQSGQSRSRSWPITQWTWESAPKQCTVIAIVEEKLQTFETILRIKWLYLHFKCGIKTNPFWMFFLHWSSLCLLNLELTHSA